MLVAVSVPLPRSLSFFFCVNFSSRLSVIAICVPEEKYMCIYINTVYIHFIWLFSVPLCFFHLFLCFSFSMFSVLSGLSL